MTSGGRELLKWLALVLMTGDHVNKVLFSGSFQWLSELGRVAFPVFAVVLAYNAAVDARPGTSGRAIRRLLVAGAIVQPFHALAFGYWLPVNVLFSLALGLYVCTARSAWAALTAWAVLGLFVDYQWTGPALMLGARLWFGARTLTGHVVAAVALGAAYGALCLYNGNCWALLSVPLLFVLGRLDVRLPRVRWVFLGYYVAHLVALAAIAST